MGFFSRVENKMEDTIEGAADRMVSAPISPVQIAKQCEKQMKRNKMVGAGKQIAPTLYTVLVNEDDDHRLFGYYPTLAGETETYIVARAHDTGLSLDGKPLVRFIADPALKHGKFDVIAECVASPIVSRLRDEEMARYGFEGHGARVGRENPAQMQHIDHSRRAPQPYEADPYDTYDEYDDYNSFNDYTTRDANDASANDYDDYPSDNGYEQLPLDGSAPQGRAAAGAAGAGAGAAAAAAAGAAVAGAAGAGAAGAAAGAAAASARPRMDLPQAQPLRATLTEHITGKRFTLSASNVKLGRETDNDIVIADMGASRYHATIARGRDCWVITDQNSTNGTLVNGREITSAPLRDGDTITIGTTEYVFAQQQR